MAFCTPCVRSTDSSVFVRSSKSIKTLLHRKIFKKSSTLIKPIHRPILKSQTNRKFERIGSNFIREIVLNSENNQTKDSISNYDMTDYEYDEYDDTQINLSSQRLKKIPRWARTSQIQLGIINQLYYDTKPEDIFGSFHLDSAQKVVNSLKLRNTDPAVIYVPSIFV